MRLSVILPALIAALSGAAWGCDLCAIYSATSASGESGQGLSLSVSQQFTAFDTVQLDGRKLPPSILDQAFVDRSMTHVAATWNFSERMGVSLNVPIVHVAFKLFQLTPTNILTEAGQDTGIGDLALIARYGFLRLQKEQFSLSANLLAGVKFPTGDARRLKQEVVSTRVLDAIYGTGHQHSASGVHLHDLTLGSGSYDGVFGLTMNSRWQRWFANAQFQYYLRTRGQSGYTFADELMISGGPGGYLLLKNTFTLSVQALATYDTMGRDTWLGRKSNNTGLTAFYLGPQVSLTVGSRYSATAGVDLPTRLDNHGLQNVPDYRAHAAVNFRF